MDLRFEQPLWLLLALAAPPLFWIGIRWLQSMSRVRALSAVVFRAIVVGLCAAMLAGAASNRRTDRLCVVVVADVSESVRQLADFGIGADGTPVSPVAAVRNWIATAAEGIRPDDLLGVVAFDAGAIAVAAPRAGGWPDTDIPLDITVGDGSNLEVAIRLARALVPADATGRIVVLSDGAETAGDAIAAIRADGQPTPIDVAPIAYSAGVESLIEFIDAPGRAPRDTAITLRIGVRATEASEGTLYVRREGRLIPIGSNGALGRPVLLQPGLNVIEAQAQLADEPLHRFEAIFEPADPAFDTIADNNRAEAFTVSPGAGSVLVIDGVGDADPDGDGVILVNTLRNAGLDVRVVEPALAPTDLLSLQAHDLVILQNVAAEEIPAQTQMLLADFVVRLGGGLVMTGGRDSFGPGGWKGTPVEPLLPVALDIPEELIVPTAAIVFVLDSSGSMGRTVLGGSRSQQQIANEAAALAIESLDPRDLIGVIAFDSIHRVVVPIGPNADPAASAARVRAIAHGGGTNMYPALQRAGTMLDGVDAQVKLVILLSDGQSEGSPSTGITLAQSMATRDITVTTIAVGDGADTETLRAIAEASDGAYYRVIDPNTLPRIFRREVRIFREPLVREEPFTPDRVASGSPLVDALPATIPALDGLILTELRPEPGIIESLRTPDGYPVLAHWQVGLGRVAAFTSDTHDWAQSWLPWQGYSLLWTRIARTIGRPPTDSTFELTTELDGDDLLLRVDALDEQGLPVDMLSIDGLLYAPSGERSEVRLSQVAPGAYEARVRAPSSGAYIAALTPQDNGRALSPIVGGVAKPSSPEMRRLRSDVGLLRLLAERSGGRTLDVSHPEDADLFNRENVEPVIASVPIWRLLMIWCLGVLLLDIGTRRVAWDRIFGAEFRAHLATLEVEREAHRTYAATRTLGALRSRKGSRSGPVAVDAGGPPPAGQSRSRGRASSPARTDQPEQQDPDRGPGVSEAPDEAATGLLAAKRRARERFLGADDTTDPDAAPDASDR